LGIIEEPLMGYIAQYNKCGLRCEDLEDTGWPLFWKTWKSQGIEKWSGKVRENRKSQGKSEKSEKSGKMNYYNYSVAAIIAQTIIGDYNNRTIDHGQLIF